MPPVNDDFANATVLSGLSGTAAVDNLGATYEAGEPANGFGSDGLCSVWFEWTPGPHSFGYDVELDTTATPETIAYPWWDSTLEVFTGATLASLTAVASDDDGGLQPGDPSGSGFGTSRVTFHAAPATTYRIRVDGWLDDGHSGQVNIGVLTYAATPTPPPAPALTTAANLSYDDGYFTGTSGTFTPGDPYSASDFPSTQMGPAGTVVKLLGFNLDTVTDVSFGAFAAAFTIISPTEIHATVPLTTAATDHVTVSGLGGSASKPYQMLFWGPWKQPADLDSPDVNAGGAHYRVLATESDATPPNPVGTTDWHPGQFLHVNLEVPDPSTYHWEMEISVLFLSFGFPDVDPTLGELAAPHVLPHQIPEYELSMGTPLGPATINVSLQGQGELTDVDPLSAGPPVPPPFTSLVQARRLGVTDYFLDIGGQPHLVSDAWPSGGFLAGEPLLAQSPLAASSSEITHTSSGGYDDLTSVRHDSPITTFTLSLADLDPSPPLGPDFPFASPAFALVSMFDNYLTDTFDVPGPGPGGFDPPTHLLMLGSVGLDGTIVYRPSRYRLLYDRPVVEPPIRRYPRDDGLALSTRRSLPVPVSVQFGQRRGPTALR